MLVDAKKVIEIRALLRITPVNETTRIFPGAKVSHLSLLL